MSHTPYPVVIYCPVSCVHYVSIFLNYNICTVNLAKLKLVFGMRFSRVFAYCFRLF